MIDALGCAEDENKLMAFLEPSLTRMNLVIVRQKSREFCCHFSREIETRLRLSPRSTWEVGDSSWKSKLVLGVSGMIAWPGLEPKVSFPNFKGDST